MPTKLLSTSSGSRVVSRLRKTLELDTGISNFDFFVRRRECSNSGNNSDVGFGTGRSGMRVCLCVRNLRGRKGCTQQELTHPHTHTCECMDARQRRRKKGTA